MRDICGIMIVVRDNLGYNFAKTKPKVTKNEGKR